MSSEAIGWVFRYSPYEGTAFTVHLAIADSVNDQADYEFWMRQKVCAAKARCSRQAVNAAIGRMVDDGLLTLVREGVGGANRYRLLMPQNVQAVFDVSSLLTPQTRGPGKRGVVPGDTPVNGDDKGVSTGTTRLSPQATQNQREPKKGSQEDPNHASKVTRIEPGSDNDPLFAAFWAAYPRKQGKGGGGGARGAWRGAIKKAPPDAIVEAAIRFANDPNLPREDTFVPLPATWLNQERWQDGPLPVRPDGRGHATGSTADEAWAEVLDALRRHGRTQTPTFTNKATAQVIGQLGWRNICMSDNLNVTKGQFARLYETAGRAPEGPAAAAGGGA